MATTPPKATQRKKWECAPQLREPQPEARTFVTGTTINGTQINDIAINGTIITRTTISGTRITGITINGTNAISTTINGGSNSTTNTSASGTSVNTPRTTNIHNPSVVETATTVVNEDHQADTTLVDLGREVREAAASIANHERELWGTKTVYLRALFPDINPTRLNHFLRREFGIPWGTDPPVWRIEVI
ncbi:hypothetical protein B0T09DRAFT_398513 [Sordaria sp. MPI-SDFR-AT-0083]|nr:hypothetical protein B0T09DRAFT_398513 [Sordaria sp. MPI-SDFR-AT-0083]